MEIVFILLFVVADWLAHINVINYRLGLHYHVYLLNLVVVIELLLAVGAVWYLGWVIGIITAIIAFFKGFYYIIGWVLSLPTYRAFDPYTVCQWAEWEAIALIPSTVVVAAFIIVSFFVTKFECLTVTLSNSTAALVVAAFVVALGPIARSWMVNNK